MILNNIREPTMDSYYDTHWHKLAKSVHKLKSVVLSQQHFTFKKAAEPQEPQAVQQVETVRRLISVSHGIDVIPNGWELGGKVFNILA